MDSRVLWTLPVLVLALFVLGAGQDRERIIARYSASVTVTPPDAHAAVGINGTRTALAFGTVPQGASVTRRITVDHAGEGAVQASLHANGTIASAITPSQQHISVSSATEQIRVTLNTSQLAPGTYDGWVTVTR